MGLAGLPVELRERVIESLPLGARSAWRETSRAARADAPPDAHPLEHVVRAPGAPPEPGAPRAVVHAAGPDGVTEQVNRVLRVLHARGERGWLRVTASVWFGIRASDQVPRGNSAGGWVVAPAGEPMLAEFQVVHVFRNDPARLFEPGELEAAPLADAERLEGFKEEFSDAYAACYYGDGAPYDHNVYTSAIEEFVDEDVHDRIAPLMRPHGGVRVSVARV